MKSLFPFRNNVHLFRAFKRPIYIVVVYLHSVLAAPLALHALILVHALSSPMADILHFLLRHGYPVLFAWVFLEQIGLPMPSSPLLFVAGALAGAGQMEFTLTMGLVIVAAMMADTAWFLWGRWRGAGVLRFVCRISLEPDTCVRRTKEAVARHGRLAILSSKFVPGLNAAAPPLAGVTGMSLGEYLALDALSALLWAGAFMGLGRIFSHQLDMLAYYVRGFGGAVLALLVALLAVYIARKYAARRKLLRGIWTERIEPLELRGLLEGGEPVAIVDLRHNMDFRLHPFVIPGATHYDPGDLDDRHQEIPRDREIVLYCT
jgi:membrane protein DedA with SNARE-associated domain